jgi:hypothetical protein
MRNDEKWSVETGGPNIRSTDKWSVETGGPNIRSTGHGTHAAYEDR